MTLHDHSHKYNQASSDGSFPEVRRCWHVSLTTNKLFQTAAELPLATNTEFSEGHKTLDQAAPTRPCNRPSSRVN